MASDERGDPILATRNTARFFTENRHISWVVLLVVVVWGVYGYTHMPKRKDPQMPVRVATAITPWPGTSAEEIEQLVTRQVEDTVAQSSVIHPPSPTSFGIKSLTLPGVSIVQIQLAESVKDPEKEFSDINLKLNGLNPSLPQGAGPIQFNSGFGETAALLLTLASPKENEVELSLRARDLAETIKRIRSAPPQDTAQRRATIVMGLPRAISPTILARSVDLFARYLEEKHAGTGIRTIEGPGFVGIDLATALDDNALLEMAADFLRTRAGIYRFHPDAWNPVVIRDPADAKAKLTQAQGDKYSYRELDQFTDIVSRALLTVPSVAKIQRAGVLQEQVFLAYSQERFAANGIQPTSIKKILSARNTVVPGGSLQVDDVNLLVQPSGSFTSETEIGDVIVATGSSKTPVYLRDLAEVFRSYQTPPRFLNFQNWRDASGDWHRSRAISLAVQMRDGQQIAAFGSAIGSTLKDLQLRLPEDLMIVRTSDQPEQVADNIDLFMTALYEAILLVVVVALLGFWEWRAAALMAIAIPTTLALTFGMVFMLGMDLQQVSVATLIIALGLLVDDPVVAGDAIKRELAAGHPPIIAAWLGPTRLATAILFATITNVVAYLPLMILTGNQGDFLKSLPVVMACALIASRVVSMTFIPFLGYYLLRPPRRAERSMEARRREGFSGMYYRVGSFCIEHRWVVLTASLLFLASGSFFKHHLKNAFFPDDVQYLSYVDVWMRNNAALSGTDAAAEETEHVIRDVAKQYGAADAGKPREVLQSVTTFVGGGAPRFWFSVTPELQQQNYAQLIVRVRDKQDTPKLIGPLQEALSARVPGAIIDVHQLQTNPVQYPVAVRIYAVTGTGGTEEAADTQTLRRLAGEAADILRSSPTAVRVRNDWGEQSMTLRLNIDSDRANLAGVSNQDVAASSAAAINGTQVATLREGEKQIPVIARMRPHERAQISDLNNLYVFSTEDTNKIPLGEVASLSYGMQTERIRRQEHARAITVFAFPQPGVLSSEVFDPLQAKFKAFEEKLPPGYKLEIGGEEAKTKEGFGQLLNVMVISAALIFLALVLQFRNAVKPLLLFAAVPYGMVGALAALYATGTPFGFMAFLGIVSLIGVIVSHVIVLFDFIEEMREKGEPLEQALLDAGIVRLRPVLITVGATVLALVPLAIHGGPLWQPLCYAQIGGLCVATFITLLLVPVMYSIFVLDLKLIKWQAEPMPLHGRAAQT